MDKIYTHELPAGTLLNGRYRVISVLGSGGFAITYRCEHTTLKLLVCIKELFISGHCTRGSGNTVQAQGLNKQDFTYYRNQFNEEARQLVRFCHPGIVQVFDVFEENDTAYYAMEFIEGESLDALIQREKLLSVLAVMELAENLMNAVEVLHGAEPPLLHRDIKPANIMLRSDGSPVLIDFGSAREYREGISISQSAILTAGYAPLEQYHAKAKRGPFMDVYAIGATLYIMLTGQKPAAATDRALSEMAQPRELNPQLPAALSDAVMKAMALKPEDRYQSVAALRAALQGSENDTDKTDYYQAEPKPTVENGQGSPYHPVKPLAKLARSPWLYAGGLLFVGAVVLLLWLFGRPRGGEQLPVLKDSTLLAPGPAPIKPDPAIDSLERRKRQLEEEIRTATDQREQVRLRQEQENTRQAQARLQADQQRREAERLAAVDETRSRSQQQKPSQPSIPPAIQRLMGNMVLVAGGNFTMGCTAEQGDDCYEDEKPAHQVTLNSFKMGKYEVTQAEWEAVMGSNPSFFSGCPSCPVEQVSWHDIQEFLGKLNALTGGNYRLPTEAEWEYAARGGNRQSGTKYSGSDIPSSVAWYEDNSGKKNHPVGQKQANALGLYDMSGNVWEWCSDKYGERYYSNSPDSNPRGPSSGSNRVLRGGSWDGNAGNCRVSYRSSPPASRDYNRGFRLVSPGS